MGYHVRVLKCFFVTVGVQCVVIKMPLHSGDILALISRRW